eukprot:TRINITY_DN30982_c0_g1_i1.p1 TRINITY_DN30982_c0_g1~~TRINITY_DN30982_c0_g1_i1.p1  ORF type:complete len:527 (+),score=61.99 TRINITY_DN30982_c0_g1_i1:274-1854(+)
MCALRSEDQMALNMTVTRFIEGQQNVKDVVRHINKVQSTFGNDTVPKPVEIASSIVKSVITSRLRESASCAIQSGKTKVDPSTVRTLADSLRDAKVSGYVEDDVDFEDFERFLRNLEVKTRLSDDEKKPSVSWLLEQLNIHAKPSPGEPCLTDVTLTCVCRELLKEMRKDDEVCNQVAKSGGISHARRILLGDMNEAREVAIGPQYPEMQACLCGILGQVASQGARYGQMNSRHKRLAKVLRQNDPFVKGPVAESGPTDAQVALDILLACLRSGVKRSEHSLVWASLIGLQQAGGNPLNRRHLILQGIILWLRRALEIYEDADQALPKAMPRPAAFSKTVHCEPPPFITLPGRTHPFNRRGSTAKERLLNSSASLPSIGGSRSAVEWFPRSPAVASLSYSNKIRPAPPAVLDTVEPHLAAQPPRLGSSQTESAKTDSGPSATSSSTHFGGTSMSPGNQKPFPSLIWTLAEDEVKDDAFYRSCDRGLLLIQLRNLLQVMESTGSALAEPFLANRCTGGSSTRFTKSP